MTAVSLVTKYPQFSKNCALIFSAFIDLCRVSENDHKIINNENIQNNYVTFLIAYAK